MRKLIGLSSLSSVVLTLPAIAFAQTQFGLMGVLQTINKFLNGLIGVIITIAIIVFFWGLVIYLTSVGEDKQKGLVQMFYGLIAIFVMVSIWGIIHLLQATFGLQGSNQPIVPGLIAPTGNF